jgi:hypothetical protein
MRFKSSYSGAIEVLEETGIPLRGRGRSWDLLAAWVLLMEAISIYSSETRPYSSQLFHLSSMCNIFAVDYQLKTSAPNILDNGLSIWYGMLLLALATGFCSG